MIVFTNALIVFFTFSLPDRVKIEKPFAVIANIKFSFTALIIIPHFYLLVPLVKSV